MKLLPRGSWLITLPLMALAVAYFTLVFRPVRSEISRLKLDLQIATDSIAEAQGKVTRVHSTRQAVERTETYLAKCQAALPKAAEVGQVYGRISRVADEANVKTTRFAPGTAADLASLRTVPLEMECRGSFQQIWELLAGLENLGDLVWVDKAEIQAKDDKSGELLLELNLVIFAGRAEISG